MVNRESPSEEETAIEHELKTWPHKLKKHIAQEMVLGGLKKHDDHQGEQDPTGKGRLWL